MNLELLAEFLDPIAAFLRDPEVNEIRINPTTAVFIERRGIIVNTGIVLDAVLVRYAAGMVAGGCNCALNEANPRLDARLDDGSRIAIVVAPACVSGTAMTIRRFPQRLTMEDLVRLGTMSAEESAHLTSQLAFRQNMVISGGTRTGKTTLARALVNTIPLTERLILIEQPSELSPDQPEQRDMLQFESQDEGFTAREAVRTALRHSPDRILIGEIRGGEAFDFIDALNTGHSGSITTVHANSAKLALDRIVTLVKRGMDLPIENIVRDIATAVQVVVHLDRTDGRRRLSEIHRVVGVSADYRSVETVAV